MRDYKAESRRREAELMHQKCIACYHKRQPDLSGSDTDHLGYIRVVDGKLERRPDWRANAYRAWHQDRQQFGMVHR